VEDEYESIPQQYSHNMNYLIRKKKEIMRWEGEWRGVEWDGYGRLWEIREFMIIWEFMRILEYIRICELVVYEEFIGNKVFFELFEFYEVL
jgi:hypothetical protein